MILQTKDLAKGTGRRAQGSDPVAVKRVIRKKKENTNLENKRLTKFDLENKGLMRTDLENKGFMRFLDKGPPLALPSEEIYSGAAWW